MFLYKLPLEKPSVVSGIPMGLVHLATNNLISYRETVQETARKAIQYQTNYCKLPENDLLEGLI